MSAIGAQEPRSLVSLIRMLSELCGQVIAFSIESGMVNFDGDACSGVIPASKES
jgi:hypothetical protein